VSVVSGCAGEGVDRSHQQRALLASAAPGSDGGLETSSFEAFYCLPQACRSHQDAGVGFLEFVGDGSTAAQHGVMVAAWHTCSIWVEWLNRARFYSESFF